MFIAKVFWADKCAGDTGNLSSPGGPRQSQADSDSRDTRGENINTFCIEINKGNLVFAEGQPVFQGSPPETAVSSSGSTTLLPLCYEIRGTAGRGYF